MTRLLSWQNKSYYMINNFDESFYLDRSQDSSQCEIENHLTLVSRHMTAVERAHYNTNIHILKTL